MLAEALSPDELAARWRTLAAEPDMPDEFELNEYGEIIMSPTPTNKHERIAFKVAQALERHLGPEATTAISVATDRGIRRPDATWMPAARWAENRDADPLPFAPDICVEVLSPRNTRAETHMKVEAYLRKGAKEVIVVGLDGQVEFFGPSGRLPASSFGLRLDLPPELF